MEPALKQRVVGAVVLVALAVIFLPMLVKGPAPQSGVSDVPLELPAAPQGDFAGEGVKTQELPLVAPGGAPASGVVGMDASEPTNPDAPASSDGMMPAATAGGDYAVSFGRYATHADAQRVVKALLGSQLPGYQEPVADKDRTLHRVRIGPFATQADAEAARLRAAHVRDDVGARVVVLGADEATGPAPSSQPVAATSAPVASEALPPARPAAATPTPAKTTPATTATAAQPKPAPAKPAPAPAKPTTVAPATKPAPSAPVQPSAPAAANTGFAVQLGAFGNADEAARLRDRARAAGLPAFVEGVRTDKGTLSRVRVGPVLTRAEADQLKAQVAAKLGIADAIVKPHP